MHKGVKYFQHILHQMDGLYPTIISISPTNLSTPKTRIKQISKQTQGTCWRKLHENTVTCNVNGRKKWKREREREICANDTLRL